MCSCQAAAAAAKLAGAPMLSPRFRRHRRPLRFHCFRRCCHRRLFCAFSWLLIVCAPSIAVAAGVFITTAAARSGSTALVVAGVALPWWHHAMQPRCQTESRRRAVKFGAPAALPSLMPPPRYQESRNRAWKQALFSFLSRGQFFGTIWAPAMKSYQKIIYLLTTVFFLTDWVLFGYYS